MSRPSSTAPASADPIATGYRRFARRKMLLMAAAALLLLIAALWSCCVGTANLTPGRIVATYIPSIESLTAAAPLSQTERTVFTLLRLPRVAVGLLAGAGLGVCGAVMQAITGNTMASPFTTGLSGAAAFGAAAVIVFGGVPVGLHKAATVGAAFVMALLCALIVYGLAALKGMGSMTLVLTGIALNYLFGALYSVMQLIASETQLSAIVSWSFGSLTAATWQDIALIAAFFALVFPLFSHHAWALNLMAQNSDETARSLGVPVGRVRVSCGIGVTLLTAAIVSFTGTIGFVGLVAPHIARLVIGGNYRVLVPFSALTGGLIVILSDMVGRTLIAPTLVPVGIVVSFVGVPLFLSLIIGRRRERA